MKAADARRAFGDLLQLFSIADTTSADCLAAYEHEHRDYEDDLVAYSAHRTGIDFIVTRNGRDFEKSPVPVLSPTEFVDLFKPADIVYGWALYGQLKLINQDYPRLPDRLGNFESLLICRNI